MPAAVVTLTRPTGSPRGPSGSCKVVYRDMTADTGTYASGGITITAAQLGLKKIYYASIDGGVATTGTAGVTANPLGITYATDGTSIVVWLYEGSAAGTALSQKTNAEALETNFTVRLRVEGY